eukprot:15335490-Ditylum_brightwellii.AAC.1
MRAFREQSAIGWRYIFNGCLPKRWATIQDEYLIDIKLKTRQLNGKTWATHILKIIWTRFFILWTLRNETKNMTDKGGHKVHRKEILSAKVEALYLLKSTLLARDQHLMFDSRK